MADSSSTQQKRDYEPVCIMDFLPTDSARLEDFVQELQNMRDDGFTIDDIPEYILETYGETMNGLNELSIQKRGRPLNTSFTKVYRLDDMIELVEELARESEEKRAHDPEIGLLPKVRTSQQNSRPTLANEQHHARPLKMGSCGFPHY